MDKRYAEELGLDTSGASDPGFGKSLQARNNLTSYTNSQTQAPLVSFSKSASVTPEGWATHKSMTINRSRQTLDNEGSGSNYFGMATLPKPPPAWTLRYAYRGPIRIQDNDVATYTVRLASAEIKRNGKPGNDRMSIVGADVAASLGDDYIPSAQYDVFTDWITTNPSRVGQSASLHLVTSFAQIDRLIVLYRTGKGFYEYATRVDLGVQRFFVGTNAQAYNLQNASDLVYQCVLLYANEGEKYYVHTVTVPKVVGPDVHLTLQLVISRIVGRDLYVWTQSVPISRIGNASTMKATSGLFGTYTLARYFQHYNPLVPAKFVPYYDIVDTVWTSATVGYCVELDLQPWPLFWNTDNYRYNPNWVVGFTDAADEVDPKTGTTYRDEEAHIVMCPVYNPATQQMEDKATGFKLMPTIPSGGGSTGIFIKSTVGYVYAGDGTRPANPVASPYLGRIRKINDYGTPTNVTNLIPLIRDYITPPGEDKHAYVCGAGLGLLDHNGAAVIGLGINVVWGKHECSFVEPTCEGGEYKNRFVWDWESEPDTELHVFYIYVTGTQASVIHHEKAPDKAYNGGWPWGGEGHAFGFVSASEDVFYCVQTRYSTGESTQTDCGNYEASKVHRFVRQSGVFSKQHSFSLSQAVGGNYTAVPRLNYIQSLALVKGVSPLIANPGYTNTRLIIPNVKKGYVGTIRLDYSVNSENVVESVEETVYEAGELIDPNNYVEDEQLFVTHYNTFVSIDNWEKSYLWQDNHVFTL